VFFYGSFINQDVLRQYGVALESFEVAKLSGFDIVIEPLATLIPSDERCVYGIVAALTHADVRKLYSQDWVSGYNPYAVLVTAAEGVLIPCLCYVAPRNEQPSAPAADYVMKIFAPAEKYGFPDWYVERLRRLL
jgi:hypothetical protein